MFGIIAILLMSPVLHKCTCYLIVFASVTVREVALHDISCREDNHVMRMQDDFNLI